MTKPDTGACLVMLAGMLGREVCVTGGDLHNFQKDRNPAGNHPTNGERRRWGLGGVRAAHSSDGAEREKKTHRASIRPVKAGKSEGAAVERR